MPLSDAQRNTLQDNFASGMSDARFAAMCDYIVNGIVRCAVAEERERCAKICDALQDRCDKWQKENANLGMSETGWRADGGSDAAIEIAAAIRNQGNGA